MASKINKLGLILLFIHTIAISIIAFIVFVLIKQDLYGGNILLFMLLVIYDAPLIYPSLFILSNMIVISDMLTRGGVPALVCIVLILGGLQWYLIGCLISKRVKAFLKQ